jgi:hypothetical protein
MAAELERRDDFQLRSKRADNAQEDSISMKLVPRSLKIICAFHLLFFVLICLCVCVS